MKISLKKTALITFTGILAGVITTGCNAAPSRLGPPDSPAYPAELSLTQDELMDKIRGGWAGQVIGCTYGGPTEFRYKGTMIQDYTPIEWDET